MHFKDKVNIDGNLIQEFICSGIGSRVGNNHVLFCDMDNYNMDKAIDITKDMIFKYKLSDCYIIRSSIGNYHMICLDKFPFGKVCSILKGNAHGQWVKYRAKAQDFVLRLSKKGRKSSPQLMCIVESPYTGKGIRRKSNAHRLVMERVYGMKIRKDKDFDSLTKLRIHMYRTRVVKK